MELSMQNQKIMKYLIILALVLSLFTPATSQVCASLDNWALVSENGDGTCTYSVSIIVDSGNGATGTASFVLNNTEVYSQSSCICNPSTISFPITVTCGSTVSIDVFYDAPGNGNDCSGNTGNIVLPVQWLDFKVEKNGDKNLLNWSVYEVGNYKYFIERGNDGQRFSSIGEINNIGVNDGAYNYSFGDTRPLNGINYYRIKQLDYDDSFSYSEIVSVDNSLIKEVLLYPNPFSNEINLHSDIMKSWKITNLQGATLLMGQENRIETTQLVSGIYYLQVIGEIHDQWIKIVKQ